LLGGLHDFTGFDTSGTDADPLISAIHFSLNRTKVDVPAALGDIMRVRDLITELRALAADFANLSHDKLQIP
jgi:hypothetical protein